MTESRRGVSGRHQPARKSILTGSPRGRTAVVYGTSAAFEILLDFRDTLWFRGRDCFTHTNFGAVAFERDFVHQLIDEIDSTAVGGLEILLGERIGHRAGDETLARIAHHDDYVGRFGASDAALHFLAGIIVAAVDDGIGERLA